jgi:acetyl esterase/lipase
MRDDPTSDHIRCAARHGAGSGGSATCRAHCPYVLSGLFALLFSALALHAQTNITLTSPIYGANRFGIQYGESGGEKLILDAHVPNGPGPFPTLIIVHGGGWMTGDKEGDIVPVLAPYATNFTWFTIGYRLAPKSRWPACFDDVQTAVHWAKQHGTEYKGDPDHIALLGYSAGGLAAEDVHVQAIVGMAPPTDLVWDNERRDGLSKSMTNLFDYATTNITDDRRAVLKRYSPLTYVKPGLQPFLFVQGSADRTVPYQGTTNFMAALQRASVPCDMLVITNGQHRIADWSKFYPDWQTGVVSWLNVKLAR